MSALHSRLAGSEERLAALLSVLNGDIVDSMRECLAAIRERVQRSDGERNQAVSEVQGAVVRACALVVQNAERQKEELLSREREASGQAIQGLEAQLQAKCKLVEELQQVTCVSVCLPFCHTL